MNITEGITLNDEGKIIVDPNIDGDIRSDFNRRLNRIGSIKGVKSFIGYKYNRGGDSASINFIRDSFKYGQIENFANEQDYKNLISKAIIKLNSIRKLNQYDCIITPKSSGTLANELAKRISTKIGIPVYTDLIVKNAVENIEIDMDRIKTKLTKADLESKLKASLKKHGGLHVKKLPFILRAAIYKFLKMDNVENEVFNTILGGNILIIDDVVTSGSTISEISRILNRYGAEEIVAFGFLGK